MTRARLTRAQFFREAARLALHGAWHASHTAHLVGVLALGALVLVGWHLPEHWLAVLAAVVLIVTAFLGLLWYAYAIYRDEYDARLLAEGELAKSRAAHAGELAALQESPRPRVAILDEVDPDPQADSPIRVFLKNVSGETVRNCSVSIVGSQPPLRGLPKQLFWEGLPGLGAVDLRPTERRAVELFQVSKDGGKATFRVRGHLYEVTDAPAFHITLRAFSDNAEPVEKIFTLDLRLGPFDFSPL